MRIYTHRLFLKVVFLIFPQIRNTIFSAFCPSLCFYLRLPKPPPRDDEPEAPPLEPPPNEGDGLLNELPLLRDEPNDEDELRCVLDGRNVELGA